MKNILFALLFIPLLSGKSEKTKALTATLDTSIVYFGYVKYILFTGNGYTPDRMVHLKMTRSDGFFNELSAGYSDEFGNISSYQTLTRGNYEIESWEFSKSRKESFYQATVNIIIQ